MCSWNPGTQAFGNSCALFYSTRYENAYLNLERHPKRTEQERSSLRIIWRTINPEGGPVRQIVAKRRIARFGAAPAARSSDLRWHGGCRGDPEEARHQFPQGKLGGLDDDPKRHFRFDKESHGCRDNPASQSNAGTAFQNHWQWLLRSSCADALHNERFSQVNPSPHNEGFAPNIMNRTSADNG